jgi:hypothetical protein
MMTKYEKLLQEAHDYNLSIFETPLTQEGFIKGSVIKINKKMPTIFKRCALAEEIGHARMSVGDILDMTNINNLQQERRARAWAYEKIVLMADVRFAIMHGYTEVWDIAEYLEVTEEFLCEAIAHYQRKGIYICDSFQDAG